MSDQEQETIRHTNHHNDDDYNDNNSPSNQEKELRLRIKAFQDVEVRTCLNESVADLKQAVRLALKAEHRYLRLICRGRLLAPDTSLVRDMGLKDGDVVHAVLAAPGVR
jgi:DUF2407 ubiquitin-like domain